MLVYVGACRAKAAVPEKVKGLVEQSEVVSAHLMETLEKANCTNTLDSTWTLRSRPRRRAARPRGTARGPTGTASSTAADAAAAAARMASYSQGEAEY